MKLHRKLISGILVCVSLLFSGCSSTLIPLTDQEEEQIVLYSAKIVSKYNRAQEMGYSYVGEDKKNKRVEYEEAEQPQDVPEQKNLTQILAVEGVEFTYQGYECSDHFSTQDVAIEDASDGMTYVILNLQAENRTEQDVEINLLNRDIAYELVMNGETSGIACTTTLSMEDLSTYYNKSLQAGEKDGVVLLFEVDQTLTKEITDMSLRIIVDQDMVYELPL